MRRELLCSVACASAAMFVSGAAADRIRLTAQQDRSQPSSFLLDFGSFGADSSTITETNFVLEISESTGKARFLSYNQIVPSLDLPSGIPTGEITVGIAPSTSSGTFFGLMGEFGTSETYLISFTNDLSAFGLESPVSQPGESSGVISGLANGAGSVTLSWSGQGQFGNPQQPVSFTYLCSVNATFTSAPACDGDVDGDGVVTDSDLGLLLDAYASGVGNGSFNALADFDLSDSVDDADLGILLNSFGTSCQ